MISKGRMAMDALKFLFKGQSKGELALRLAPDIMFGGLEAAMTPGDLGDKIIAGTGSAVGATTGGLLLGKLGRGNLLATQALDLAGSLSGDFAGRAGADAVLKGKDLVMGGKGQTPYERLSEQQQVDLRKAIKTQVLADLGLLPGSAQQYLTDPTTGMGVA